jgi:hypothetical protein
MAMAWTMPEKLYQLPLLLTVGNHAVFFRAKACNDKLGVLEKKIMILEV